jgi:hypothetical protein
MSMYLITTNWISTGRRLSGAAICLPHHPIKWEP